MSLLINYFTYLSSSITSTENISAYIKGRHGLLVFMALFCATMRRNSVSLLRSPFLCHVQVFLCEISLIIIFQSILSSSTGSFVIFSSVLHFHICNLSSCSSLDTIAWWHHQDFSKALGGNGCRKLNKN